MPRIDEKKYSDMIEALNSFSKSVLQSSKEMLTQVKTCAQGLGDDDPAAQASLDDITNSVDHYMNAAGQATKIAKDMEYACANANIGYDQSQNYTLFNVAKKVGFDCSKVTDEESVSSINQTRSALNESCSRLSGAVSNLENVYTGNAQGLGPHAAEIGSLLEGIKSEQTIAEKKVQLLSIKLGKASAIRERIINNNRYKGSQDGVADSGSSGAGKGSSSSGSGSGTHSISYGNSKWIPDDDKIPGKANPEGKKWRDIKKEYDIDGIDFVDGEPNFTEIARGEAHIEDFTDDRYKNFSQADEYEAARRGCEPKDVKEWRQKNGYTWHERRDCKTMDKVPSIVHNNVFHSGGISEKKKIMNLEEWL